MIDPRKNFFVLFPTFAWIAISNLSLAQGTVSLEVVIVGGTPISAGHDWLDILKDAGFSNLRIRSARPEDEIKVTPTETTAEPSYHVIGVLTGDNRLRLPGNHFSMRDGRHIQHWVNTLGEAGPEGLFEPTVAFGLSAELLVQLHDDLARPLTKPTKGRSSKQIVREIARIVDFRIKIDSAVRKSFPANFPVADELQGISAGTSLAAVLRPLGLALVPQKDNRRQIVWAVTDARKAAELWPVGWPSKEKARETVPMLFEFLQVDIQRQPLLNVLQELEKRLEIPILFDHIGLAAEGIDPATVIVSMPASRTFYKRIVDRLLIPQKLNSEIRLDEAGKPFMWICSLKY